VTNYEKAGASCLLKVKSQKRAGNARSFEARPMLNASLADFSVNDEIICKINLYTTLLMSFIIQQTLKLYIVYGEANSR